MSDNALNKKVRFSGKMSFVSSNPNSNIVVNEGAGDGESVSLDELEKEEQKAKYQAAYNDGWKACEKKMSAEIAGLNQKINSLSQKIPLSLNEYLKDLEAQAKSEIVEMAFAVASIILGGEISGETPLKPILDEALAPVLNLKGLKIHLNPAVAGKAVAGDDNGIPPGAEIVPDPRLGDGEALIESSQGIIDATLKGRLEALKENYLKILAEEKSKNA